MARSLDDIASELDSLAAVDFDESSPQATGLDRLGRLCDELKAFGDPVAATPILFRTMERLDESELGSPGPLVHTLEAWDGTYEPFLAESVRRKPTRLSVWMMNRILNANPPNRDAWLALLRSVAQHPMASAATSADARRFLEYQARAKER